MLLDENAKKEAVPILEKIIDLGNNNIYITEAKHALGNISGLSEIQSEKLLVPSEIISIVYDFQTTRDESELNPVFELLELPENSYELFALDFLKERYKLLAIENILQNKKNNCSERLKERINYILN